MRRSNSTLENPKSDPHPWLEEKVYARLRQLTVDLVKRSVDALSLDKQRVSLTTVEALVEGVGHRREWERGI